MRTSTDRIDQLALVWLVVPRKKSPVGDFAKQLKNIAPGADDQKRLASESIARLQERGLIERGRGLALTEAGRRHALEVLGVPGLPGKKPTWLWAKKVLFLRGIGTDPTPTAMLKAGDADTIAARIVARTYKLDRKIEGSASKVLAVLARRALGLEDRPSFKFEDAFSAIVLSDAAIAEQDEGRNHGNSGFAVAKVSLRLEECSLREFASQVTDAARSATTGRWHGAVFISHVWDTLRARGDVGITFEKFQRRLIEAFQKDLIELSRADLVEAMPAGDVSASETTHSGARFHFVRVGQLAN